MVEKHDGVPFAQPKTLKRVQLRFPDDTLLERLRRLAKEDNRSLNGEILQALQEFVDQRERHI